MPITAKYNGIRINIQDFEDPKRELDATALSCPFCGGAFIIRGMHWRRGFSVAAHFVHKTECTADLEGQPESPNHILGKKIVAEVVQRELAERGIDCTVQIEVGIEMSWRVKGRIADIVITAQGCQTVHEIQFAAIGRDEIEQRTKDYAKAGYETFWWLGGKANTETNRRHLLDLFGNLWATFEIGDPIRERIKLADTREQTPPPNVFHSDGGDIQGDRIQIADGHPRDRRADNQFPFD